MTTTSELWDAENIYDERISPLMSQIIAVCKEHRIPMAATFQYQTSEENGDGYCTTTIPINGRTGERMARIIEAMRPERPVLLAETVTIDPETGARSIIIRSVT